MEVIDPLLRHPISGKTTLDLGVMLLYAFSRTRLSRSAVLGFHLVSANAVRRSLIQYTEPSTPHNASFMHISVWALSVSLVVTNEISF